MGLDNQMPVGKIGAKKQRRLEMKEEKKLLREVQRNCILTNGIYNILLFCPSYSYADSEVKKEKM